jgi:cation transport ATPase
MTLRPGESVPVDGVILDGRSAIDESMVTGESMPVTKSVGEKVISGTINQSGGFVMRADKVGRDTVLAQIVQMVAQAQRSRAPIQRLADQVAGMFVPAVIAVAALAFAAWSIWGPEPGRRLVIGNQRIMTEAGIDITALSGTADEMRRDGATAIFVAIDGTAAGIIAIADPIKATTPQAIKALQEAGIRVVMLTGDNRTTAQAVAAKLGITEVEAEVLPEDKSKVVERFRAQGRQATASTTHRRWLPPTSASPWAQALMSPWRALASRF